MQERTFASRLELKHQNQDSPGSDTNATIRSDCEGLTQFDNVEEVKYAKTELFIENNHKEIQARYSGNVELRGMLPAMLA